MGDDKGKSRALPKDDDSKNQPDETSQGSSILSRVAASATGLSRNVFSAPNSRELNEGAVAALANSGKGQPSAAGSSLALTESSRAPQQSEHQNAVRSKTFRSGQHEQHVMQSEDEFSSFLDGIDSLSSQPSNVVGVDQLLSGGLIDENFGNAWARSQEPGNVTFQPGPQQRTIEEQQRLDGEDVSAILGEPGDAVGPFEAPQEEEENYDWGLSAELLTQLRAMTKDLFPPPERHSVISPDHPLNLVPSFGANTSAPQMGAHADESFMYLGAHSDPATARQLWRDQWEGVLTRYTDEVWAGLLPLVKEARKEVEELRDDPSITEQPKALRRLGAILGHLRNHGPIYG